MVMGTKATLLLRLLLHAVLLLWLNSRTCHGVKGDIECLRAVKDSLEDPNGYLSSWVFDNMTEGFICNFNGIECWHPDETKVLNIRLSDMGLRGQFPLALKNCKSMIELDLSVNELDGSLPDNIDRIIPYVVTLNLSFNNFSGQIPRSISNITYLNSLDLQYNRFIGQIPAQLTRLVRLKSFSVAGNNLSGPIPYFQQKFGSSSFENNFALRCWPLDPCPQPKKKSHIPVIIAGVLGGIGCASVAVAAAVFLLFRLPEASENTEDDVEGNQWAKSIKGTKDMMICIFEKSVPKMRLFNLMKATNNFSTESIMGKGRTGTMYRATLPDGTLLAVKRLVETYHSDKHFVSEMETLGSIKHPNLVPLVGFCIARKERLLIYKYMPKGSLYQTLHQPKANSKFIEWPLRLRIAIGAARGLAWLHHMCKPRIIHRNLSSKRILLDENFEPKISDFGFARFMNLADTHVSTLDEEICNTGIVAPEDMLALVATPKGDVFSFGMVLLELITGKEPFEVANALQNAKENLVEWIAFLSNYYAIDQPSLGRDCDSEMLAFLRVAFACIVSAPEERPNMWEVYHLLRDIGKQYGLTCQYEVMTPPISVDVDCPADPPVKPEMQEIGRESTSMVNK